MDGTGEHDLTAALAVDALEGEEAAVALSHVERCSTCRTDLAETRAALSGTLPVQRADEEAAARLKGSVMAALDELDTAPGLRAVPTVAATPAVSAVSAVPAVTAADGGRSAPPTDELARRRDRRRPRRWVPALAAAAAAVVVAGAALTGVWALQLREQAGVAEQAAAVVAQVAAAPDVVTVAAQDGEGGAADGWSGTRVLVSRSLGEAVIVPQGAGAAPEGRTWQLWFVGDDGARPAGTFEAGSTPAVLTGSPDGAQAVAVTLEPRGGSETPTTTPVAVYPISA